MNIMQINTAILQGGFTNDQLTSIVDAVKFARARLVDMNKRSLRIGDAVSFRPSKAVSRVPVTGIVQKIAIKFVTVKTAQGLWKVPANMLTTVMEAEYA